MSPATRIPPALPMTTSAATPWRYRDYVVRALQRRQAVRTNFVARADRRRRDRSRQSGDAHRHRISAHGAVGNSPPWKSPGSPRQRFLDDVTNSVGETFLAQLAAMRALPRPQVRSRAHARLLRHPGGFHHGPQLSERDAAFLPSEKQEWLCGKDSYLEQSRAEHYATLTMLDEKSLKAAESVVWRKRKSIPQSGRPRWTRARQSPQLKRGSLFNTTRDLLLKQGRAGRNQFPPRHAGLGARGDWGSSASPTKAWSAFPGRWDRYKPYALSVLRWGALPRSPRSTTPLRMAANRLTEGRTRRAVHSHGRRPPLRTARQYRRASLERPGRCAEDTDSRRKSKDAGRPSPNGVASKDNPLTTRAIVNRLWLWHFNQAIAGKSQ